MEVNKFKKDVRESGASHLSGKLLRLFILRLSQAFFYLFVFRRNLFGKIVRFVKRFRWPNRLKNRDSNLSRHLRTENSSAASKLDTSIPSDGSRKKFREKAFGGCAV